MSKVRIYEVAKELGMEHKALVALFQSLGFGDVRNHMSSVEPELVDRVRRHLEKQKTPSVVEERIRPTVVKRRAAPKPVVEASVPAAVASVPAVPVEVPSRSARVSAPVEPPPVAEPERVVERASVRRVERASDEVAPPVVVAPPEPPPVVAHEPEPAPVMAHPAVVLPPPPPPVEEPAPVAAAAAPVAVAEEPAAPPPSSTATPTSAPRVSAAPRTGIETWAGRPGVPMPPPPAPRTAGGPVPRRVSYDPRAGASAPGAARPGMRPGAPMAGRPMSRMGGMMGNRRMGPNISGPRRPTMVSTQEMSAHKKVIKIEEKISLQTLAGRMSLKSTEVLMKLLSLGMTGVNINTTLDADTAKIVAGEFGWDVEDVAVSEEQAIEQARAVGEVTNEGLETRPPIVTVMGHVDHGKTSLLDRIRKANVAGGEAGGITQHIGAYRVATSKGPVTFLDTPGHEAFTQMRARGASVTDIVVLVVAADDGVMPQTKEAAAHAKSAKVPIIVAINKMDKPGADPERVKRELVECGLVPEDWGGDTIFCPLSAKTGEGVETLLEMIALQAEILELRASPKRPAKGRVIEALLDRGKGPVARVLVTDGTLHVGDVVIAGPAWGKVRAMTDEHGRNVAEAGPSTPVELLGLSDVPNAGDPVDALKDVKKAQEIADSRKTKVSRSLVPASAKVSLEDLARRMAEADQLELRLIIKADVQGSVEAVADALAKLTTEKVRVAIIHAGVGGITEGDVNLAVASKAIIVGFSVRPAGKAASLAESEDIEIRLYNIIYNAVDDVKKAMQGLLAPTLVEKPLGKAEVRQVFKIGKLGTIAGCMVLDGTVKRSGKARVVRDAVQVWEGKLSGLRRFKDDVSSVDNGFECGIMLEGYNDLKPADIVECFEVEEVAATL